MTYLEPLLPILLVLSILGLYRSWKQQQRTPAVLLLGIIGLFASSWPPLEWLFVQPLEMRYSRRPPERQTQAIVVLAGAALPPTRNRPFGILGEDTYRRCLYAAWLYRREPLPILVSGGIAPLMRHVLETEGLPPDAILVESDSHDTHENAVYSTVLLRERGFDTMTLVLEARDLPRASACFRKEGITVVPFPCKFDDFNFSVDQLLPSAKALHENGAMLHEVVGMLWYFIRGWI
jgi:uncharacterized SAM-binding protein YcdF (DUF218 family)